MSGIIATVGPSIATENNINILLKKKVVDFWVNYGLQKNSFNYLSLLNKVREKKHIPLNIYLELPGSRCRHGKKKGELLEDETYFIYDKNENIDDNDEHYMVMSGLGEIINEFEIGEKIYYEDGLVIFSIKNIDIEKKRLTVICNLYSKNSVITEGSAVSFDGIEKSYEVIRNEDRVFLKNIKEAKMIPDFIAVSFCKNDSDVKNVRNEIENILEKNIKLLVKIQNHSSVKNIEKIISCADGIVIERGDLIYVLNDQLPFVQQTIIEKARYEKKTVIVASGFMSEFSRTSTINRSEQSDVYRLQEEGGDFLLLTKETGKAPHAVATIDEINKILSSGAQVI